MLAGDQINVRYYSAQTASRDAPAHITVFTLVKSNCLASGSFTILIPVAGTILNREAFISAAFRKYGRKSKVGMATKYKPTKEGMRRPEMMPYM